MVLHLPLVVETHLRMTFLIRVMGNASSNAHDRQFRCRSLSLQVLEALMTEVGYIQCPTSLRLGEHGTSVRCDDFHLLYPTRRLLGHLKGLQRATQRHIRVPSLKSTEELRF